MKLTNAFRLSIVNSVLLGSLAVSWGDGRDCNQGGTAGIHLCGADRPFEKVAEIEIGDGAATWLMKFLPSGRKLVVAGDTVGVWDVAGRRLDKRLPVQGDTVRMSMSSDGGLLALESGDFENDYDNGAISIWNLRTSTMREKLKEAFMPMNDLTLSPDGRTLAYLRSDIDGIYKTIVIWSVRKNRKIRTFKYRTGVDIAFSPDNSMLALGVRDGVVLWNTRARRIAITLPQPGVHYVKFSPDGDVLATINERFRGGIAVSFWNVRTGRLLYAIPISGYDPTLMEFCPHSNVFAVAGDRRGYYDASSKKWIDAPAGILQTLDVKRRKWLQYLRLDNNGIQALAAAPDGDVLATSDNLGAITLWQVGH